MAPTLSALLSQYVVIVILVVPSSHSSYHFLSNVTFSQYINPCLKEKQTTTIPTKPLRQVSFAFIVQKKNVHVAFIIFTLLYLLDKVPKQSHINCNKFFLQLSFLPAIISYRPPCKVYPLTMGAPKGCI